MKQEIPQPNLLKGCLYSLTAFFFFALLGLALKETTLYGATPLQSIAVTSASASLLITPFVIREGLSYLKTEHFLFHFYRAGYGTIASILYTYAMQHIPVVNATLLFNTAPIFIPLFGIYLLRQPVTAKEWIAIAIGFLGVTLVIHPTLEIFRDPINLIALLSGAFLAIAFIYIKKLSPTDPPLRIIYYFFTLSALMMTPALVTAISQLSLQSIGYAIAAGCCLVATQYLLTKAYQYGKPSRVGVFQYTTIVFVGLIEWLIWGHRPSAIDFIGFLLVAGAGTAIIMGGNDKKQLPISQTQSR